MIFLTLLTQLGGLAWVASRFFKRSILAFLILYTAISFLTVWVAPNFGRVALPCASNPELQMQSIFFCALNRHYTTPQLRTTLEDYAGQISAAHPNTETRILDANFPFIVGFPLLPHLSHDDGRKVDLAFYYERNGTYLPGTARSPIGYFAFQQGVTNCSDTGLTLRWNLRWLQPLFPKYDLDKTRMRTALQILQEDPRVEKLFIEPHILAELGVKGEKIRFQGCRAARHDDHIHFQIM
ncbi:MAG: hypothetical protein AAF429_10570 [Pseudomonadota bacterium]